MAEIAEVRIHRQDCPQSVLRPLTRGKTLAETLGVLQERISNLNPSGEYEIALSLIADQLYSIQHRIEHGDRDPWDCICQPPEEI